MLNKYNRYGVVQMMCIPSEDQRWTKTTFRPRRTEIELMRKTEVIGMQDKTYNGVSISPSNVLDHLKRKIPHEPMNGYPWKRRITFVIGMKPPGWKGLRRIAKYNDQ